MFSSARLTADDDDTIRTTNKIWLVRIMIMSHYLSFRLCVSMREHEFVKHWPTLLIDKLGPMNCTNRQSS